MQLLEILNKVNVTLAASTKIPLLDVLGDHNTAGIIKAIKAGKRGKITLDNIDALITANQVRMGSGNKSIHFTHVTYYVDRMNNDDFRDYELPPQAPEFDTSVFFLNSSEAANMREMYRFVHYIVHLRLQS